MLKDIKKAISMVKGVGKITLPRSKRLSSYERSLRDLDEGRVFEYDSLDDLIKEIVLVNSGSHSENLVILCHWPAHPIISELA